MKFLAYLSFLLILPMNYNWALVAYFTAVIVNAITHLAKRSTVSENPMQEAVADEDLFSVSGLLFMQLCNDQLKVIYIVGMVIWAVLNIAEVGYELSKSPRYASLRVLQPYFCWLLAHEIHLIQLKSHLETFIHFWSPFLWLPCGFCAPLYPLLVV